MNRRPPRRSLPPRRSRADIVDLTSKMTTDGSLAWDVPEGKWTILRMGYALTGAKNRPATAAGSGLEVDKLSRKHVEAYFHGYTIRSPRPSGLYSAKACATC